MYYIRLVTAFVAMVLSFVCFESADTAAVISQRANQPEAAAVDSMASSTETAVWEYGECTQTPAVLCMSAALMRTEDSYAYDDSALDIVSDGHDYTAPALTVSEIEAREAERRAEEERLRAEEEQRRIAEQKRLAAEAKRKAAAAKAAKEAALQAACPGYDADFVATLTKEEQAEARYFYEQGFVYYRQNWSVLDDQYYGNEGFGLCGCGPTCIAAIISNLAGVPVDPEEMRVYGLSVGSWVPSGGTSYGFLIETAKKYGISTTQICASDKESLFEALRDDNKLVLATMGPGDFTYGAHFMLFRGITDEGKILIADSYSYEYSLMEWDYDYLYAQLKNGYWIFEKTE